MAAAFFAGPAIPNLHPGLPSATQVIKSPVLTVLGCSGSQVAGGWVPFWVPRVELQRGQPGGRGPPCGELRTSPVTWAPALVPNIAALAVPSRDEGQGEGLRGGVVPRGLRIQRGEKDHTCPIWIFLNCSLQQNGRYNVRNKKPAVSDVTGPPPCAYSGGTGCFGDLSLTFVPW